MRLTRRKAATGMGMVLLLAGSAGAGVSESLYYGAELSDAGIQDFTFPMSETELTGWIMAAERDRLYSHGWGIWTALTANSGRRARGMDDAPVFLTWMTPEEVLAVLNDEGAGPGDRELILQAARQHGGGTEVASDVVEPSAGPDDSVVVTVNYSPAASRHALDNRLLWKSTLDLLMDAGYSDVPPFPNDAVTLKPVYKLVSQAKLNNEGLYTMPAWPGPPAEPRAFPESDWPDCVHIDPANGGEGSGQVDEGCLGATPETTYNLDDFINVPITGADQAAFESLVGDQARPDVGDTLILVGMHVTGREISRWTWQTFWWTPDPAAPHAPSSEAVAAARPDALSGAPANYAMALAYQMLEPAQPIAGGENVGRLLPVYNPHLEAGKPRQNFQIQRPVATPDGSVTAEVGVQSNCMSCHGLASYQPVYDYEANPELRGQPYAANAYFPADDPIFENTLKLDFTWSLLGVLDLDK